MRALKIWLYDKMQQNEKTRKFMENNGFHDASDFCLHEGIAYHKVYEQIQKMEQHQYDDMVEELK